MMIRWLSVGRPVTKTYEGKEVETAIFKTPVEGPIFVSTTGFTGDQQADTVHHGGPNKAVCVHCYARYPYWEKELGKELGPSAFGENLTVEELTEEDVFIGDIYKVGEATLQVAQPRIPCFKNSVKHGVPGVAQKMMDTGYTGFYLRVLKEGHIKAGDRFELISRPENTVSVAFCNRIGYQDNKNLDGVRRILEAEGIAEPWQNWMRKLLG